MRSVLRIVLAVLLGVGGGWLFKRFSDRKPSAEKPEVKAVAAKVQPVDQPEKSPEKAQDKRDQPIVVTGYIRRGSRINVQLSDGRTLIEDDPSLGKVTRASAIVDGKRLYLLKPQPRPVVDRTPPPKDADKPAEKLQETAVEEKSDWVTDKYGITRNIAPNRMAQSTVEGFLRSGSP